MTRLRRVKRYSGVWTIKLEPTDVEDYGLVEGDIVDIEDLNLLKMKRSRKK